MENKESSERERRALILIKRAEAEALQPRSRGRNDLSWITKIVASIPATYSVVAPKQFPCH
jgi:hypothetical protein